MGKHYFQKVATREPLWLINVSKANIIKIEWLVTHTCPNQILNQNYKVKIKEIENLLRKPEYIYIPYRSDYKTGGNRIMNVIKNSYYHDEMKLHDN